MSGSSSRDDRWMIAMVRTGRRLATDVRIARSLRQRMVGLLGRTALPAGEGLILPRCHFIHTIGMRMAIDAVFVDAGWRVVALRPTLSPGRVVLPVRGVWGVVELGEGEIARAGVQVGDQLLLTARGS